MDGWLFLGIVTLMSIGIFFNGVRFARMTNNPFAGRKIGPFPVEGSELPISRIRLIGRVQMIFAPLFLIFVAAIVLGLFGPVDGIQTITIVS